MLHPEDFFAAGGALVPEASELPPVAATVDPEAWLPLEEPLLAVSVPLLPPEVVLPDVLPLVTPPPPASSAAASS